MEDRRESDWLASLRRRGLGEEPQMAEDLRDQAGPADATPDVQGLLDQSDMMEDLREQAIQAEAELEREGRSALVQFLSGMEPWQRLVLAVLLFLDVAVCGCMALVMAGRVMLPF